MLKNEVNPMYRVKLGLRTEGRSAKYCSLKRRTMVRRVLPSVSISSKTDLLVLSFQAAPYQQQVGFRRSRWRKRRLPSSHRFLYWFAHEVSSTISFSLSRQDSLFFFCNVIRKRQAVVCHPFRPPNLSRLHLTSTPPNLTMRFATRRRSTSSSV